MEERRLTIEFDICLAGSNDSNRYLLRSIVRAMNEALTPEQREAVYTRLQKEEGSLKLKDGFNKEAEARGVRVVEIRPFSF